MTTYYFKEEQKVRQPWIYMMMLVVLGLWIWQLIQQVIMGIPFGSNPAPDAVVLLMGIIPVGAFILIFSLKLETSVDKNGIHYHLWPLQPKFKDIGKDEIVHWEVKKYNPVKDYGGWGIRYGFGKKGMAINIRGNQGAYFELKKGKKILIGTQKPEELRSALNRMMAREN